MGANARPRVSHANGAGYGVPASERGGGCGGAKPPAKAMKDASICGLGQTAYSAIESAIKRLRLYDVAGAGR
jgi:hypothetical protein